jgi:hypothetical protein
LCMRHLIRLQKNARESMLFKNYLQ